MMTESKHRHAENPKGIVVKVQRYLRYQSATMVFAFFPVVLVACANGTVPPSTREPSSAFAPTPTLKVYVAAEATPKPVIYTASTPMPRTVEEVMRITNNSPSFMASKHQAEGVQCRDCHNPFPPMEAPSKATCLACHAEIYAMLIASTTKVSNPHNSHLGEIPCWDCHRGHEPFRPSCLQCHTDAEDCCTIH